MNYNSTVMTLAHRLYRALGTVLQFRKRAYRAPVMKVAA